MLNYREILQKKFEEEYTRLNLQQRKAVDTIEGPVMVIAGPGTGKTQILAARIGKILLDTDTSPENILCLTYTDAGTIAMRKRLVQFIGADAYKVNIYTFHSFCNDVIQDNLSLFEKTSLDAVSELESIQLFKILIDAFPKDHPLKRYRGDVYYEINNLRSLFSVMKREGWTPEFINARIDAYLSDLPQRDEYIAKRAIKEFKKGDLRTDKIAEEEDRMKRLRAAVDEFPNYQNLMRKKNRYDFDDMINWVIRVFEERPDILSGYQERFQYILVDEYQDTSGIQNRLVQLLISYWSVPNIFVVGDDDQSIYRFQGANVENMLGFSQAFSNDLLTVVLTHNYRSTQPILDVSKALIDRNRERLIRKIAGLSKDLIASNVLINDLKNPPVLLEYNSVKEEMAGITHQVHDLLVQKNVSPGSIAIIYKENKYIDAIAKYLRLRGIPVYSRRSINILEDPFIKKLVQWLRYLYAEHDMPYGGDEMLFEILHYDFYRIPPIEIAKITVEVNQKKYSSEPSSLRRHLYEKSHMPPRDLFDKGACEELKQISDVIEQLIADVSNVTLQQLFAAIIQKGGVLSYVMQHPDKINLLQLLTALFDFIKEETSRNPSLDLGGLIAILDLMEKENLSLPMVQVSGNDKGVNVLTAHGSKGLEFEYVFFAGVNASSWEKKRKPGGGYKFPDTLFASQPQSSDEEELRRLFYVALTRASKFLNISYAAYQNDGKQMERSMFIEEIMAHRLVEAEKIQVPPEQMTAFEILQLSNQVPEIERAEEDFIDALLEKFVMNVTALSNYLKCPLQFYYQSLIRIPTGKNEATEFGNAVHFALERLFRKMMEMDHIFPAKEDLVADFKWYMRRNREHFTPEAFDRRIEYGETVLGNYYDKYISSWNTVVSVERNIRGIAVNDVPLKGKLDKLEFEGKDVNVVDYKTGDIVKALPKLKAPHEKDPNGGDYWRQAVFYKILLDNYTQKGWNVISSEFDFIEPDKAGKYSKVRIVINPQDIETVKQQINMVWARIRAKDFYTGCGKDDCHWCNFIKNNGLAIVQHDAIEEEA